MRNYKGGQKRKYSRGEGPETKEMEHREDSAQQYVPKEMAHTENHRPNNTSNTGRENKYANRCANRNQR